MAKKQTPGDTVIETLVISDIMLCEITGMTDNHHRELARDGHYPSPVDSQYKCKEVLKGIIAHLRNKSSRKTLTSLEEERKRLVCEQANLAEIETLKAKHEVISTDAVFSVWENVLTPVRRIILASKMSDADKDALLAEIHASIEKDDYVKAIKSTNESETQ